MYAPISDMDRGDDCIQSGRYGVSLDGNEESGQAASMSGQANLFPTIRRSGLFTKSSKPVSLGG